jgi:uncharacterized protein YuzE
MKVTYDAEVDVLRIVFRDGAVHESDESRPGVILDYDEHGQVVSLELLDASTQVTEPRVVELALAG